MWIAWYDYLLPDGVKVGAEVIAYGKLMTFGNARTSQIVDAVLIEGIQQVKLGAALAEALADYIVEPPAKPGTANGHDQS